MSCMGMVPHIKQVPRDAKSVKDTIIKSVEQQERLVNITGEITLVHAKDELLPK